MSVFCEEMIEPLLGLWTVSYSKSDPQPVRTVVAFDKSSKILQIEQAWGHDTRVVPAENMRLYSSEELRALVENTGFVNTRVFFPSVVSSAPASSGKTGLAMVIAQMR
jgi:hypothetical protein